MNQSDRQIFQDVPDEIDETWTHGVLVGGMASEPHDLNIARSYLQAAGELVNSALASLEPWELAYPIFFLYRHCLELYLKALVRPTKLSHSLGSLIEQLDEQLDLRLQQRLPSDLKQDLQMFAQIDGDSQGFRYSHSRSGKARGLPGEYWVPLTNLKETMEAHCRTLEQLGQLL